MANTRQANLLKQIAAERRVGTRPVNPPLVGVLVGGPAARSKHLEYAFVFFLLQGAGGILAIWWLLTQPTGWVEWSAFIAGYLTVNFGIGAGFHRYFSHRSYETSRWMRALLAICGQMAAQGSIINWTADHRRHHVFPGVPGDPYGPGIDGQGRKTSGFKSFWASHLGWLYDNTHSDWSIYAKGIADDPIIRFVHHTRYFWAVASIILLPAAWALVFGGPEHVIGTILIGGSLRALIFSNGVAFTNSLAHSFGYQHFEDKGGSRNNWFVALLTGGDGWHNPHHAAPRIASNQITWWELDWNGSTIHLMERLGLAWNVQRRPKGDAKRLPRHMRKLTPTARIPGMARGHHRAVADPAEHGMQAASPSALFRGPPSDEPLVAAAGRERGSAPVIAAGTDDFTRVG